MDHSLYDKRGYPIVDVREGYGEWVRTYEKTVQDEMDLRLLERLETVDWSRPREILDLACGTGRVGAWLAGRTPAAIDGVDLTPEMLEVSEARGLYRSLRVADVAETGLASSAYDLCIQSLADEHLERLSPLYEEAARLTRPSGSFVLAGFHPHFLMLGMPTHFENALGEPITIRSYVHLLSDHVKAGRACGWSLQEMDERLVDQAWLSRKPQWEKYRGVPVSFVMVWRKE